MQSSSEMLGDSNVRAGVMLLMSRGVILLTQCDIFSSIYPDYSIFHLEFFNALFEHMIWSTH